MNSTYVCVYGNRIERAAITTALAIQPLQSPLTFSQQRANINQTLTLLPTLSAPVQNHNSNASQYICNMCTANMKQNFCLIRSLYLHVEYSIFVRRQRRHRNTCLFSTIHCARQNFTRFAKIRS